MTTTAETHEVSELEGAPFLLMECLACGGGSTGIGTGDVSDFLAGHEDCRAAVTTVKVTLPLAAMDDDSWRAADTLWTKEVTRRGFRRVGQPRLTTSEATPDTCIMVGPVVPAGHRRRDLFGEVDTTEDLPVAPPFGGDEYAPG